MLDTNGPGDFGGRQTDRVPLRTLILLRWMAIVGQVVALVASQVLLHLTLPVGPCTAVVAASIIANLVATLAYPANRRLSDIETLAMLSFDLLQLGLLLFLTGGLTNPFALLVLAPVAISATTLTLRATLIVAALSVLLVTILALFDVPLRSADGPTLTVPPVFKFGFWLALTIGIGFIGLYTRRVSSEVRALSDALFAAQMALAREQTLTDLGGVVAAAAHELGTPLATIKLVSSELIDELAGQDHLLLDARLIGQQVDRCRDILRSMGRVGKDDPYLRQTPLNALLSEAAEPHLGRGKVVTIAAAETRQPNIQRRPEIVHGLRNLIQNAVDFASEQVWIDPVWDRTELVVRIVDDGPGFPQHLIGRMGDPFVRSRRPDPDQRPDYDGMGLGLFIAKTLLERTGARLTFSNAADPFLSPLERPARSGAVVTVRWPLDRILARGDLAHGINQAHQI